MKNTEYHGRLAETVRAGFRSVSHKIKDAYQFAKIYISVMKKIWRGEI